MIRRKHNSCQHFNLQRRLMELRDGQQTLGGQMMIASGDALIGTTIHRVAQHIQQRIDDESREPGQTRLSWMAAAHVDDSPAS